MRNRQRHIREGDTERQTAWKTEGQKEAARAAAGPAPRPVFPDQRGPSDRWLPGRHFMTQDHSLSLFPQGCAPEAGGLSGWLQPHLWSVLLHQLRLQAPKKSLEKQAHVWPGSPWELGGGENPTHTMLASPPPEVGFWTQHRQVPRKWFKSLWPGCVYHMTPWEGVWSGREVPGGLFQHWAWGLEDHRTRRLGPGQLSVWLWGGMVA